MNSVTFRIKDEVASSAEEVVNFFEKSGFKVVKVFESEGEYFVVVKGEGVEGVFVVKKEREVEESLNFLEVRGKFPLASIDVIRSGRMSFENCYLKKLLETLPDSAILSGKTGSGKTTAVTYFAFSELKKRKINFPLRFSLIEFSEGIDFSQVERADFIFVDDLNSSIFNQRMLEDVVKLIYFCYDNKKRLFIATNEGPKGLNFLPETILSRLAEKCQVIYGDVRDYRLKAR